MDHNEGAALMKSIAVQEGWTTYTSPSYSFIVFEPLPAQKTYINHTAPPSPGQTHTTEAYTADYDEIANNRLCFVLYRNSANGISYVGVGGPSLSNVVPLHPPGDGSPNNDNGVRIDIALKSVITLSEADKLKLINQFIPLQPLYNDDTQAYFYEHGPGF